MMFNEWKKLGLNEKKALLAAEEKSNTKAVTRAATKEIEMPYWREVRIVVGNCRAELSPTWVSCPVETGTQRK